MKNFDPKYNDIPKAEIHCHLEGAIRTQTIIDIAREYSLVLPSYEAAELDKHIREEIFAVEVVFLLIYN